MYSWCLIYILVYISGYIIALVMGVPNYWMVYSGKSTSINLVGGLEHDFFVIHWEE